MNDFFFFFSCYLMLPPEPTLLQISGVAFVFIPLSFLICLQCLCSGSLLSRQGWKKAPEVAYQDTLCSTQAPCTALPVARTPSLTPHDFLEGTNPHFKLSFGSGMAWGTASAGRGSYRDYTSWTRCPQRSHICFFQDLTANISGIKAAFINDSSACSAMHNSHVHTLARQLLALAPPTSIAKCSW